MPWTPAGFSDRDAVNGFVASVASCNHTINNSWRGDGTLVCEGDVRYRRHGNTTISLSFVNVFEFDGELISNYRIYIDVAPLYAD
jgi:limonene-1,2-epoxide hydrolase